ncbi:MAG TPA: hypothetical protein ENH29_03035 [Bacteroidetes bacterium]|nr:hypothetical protein [Bacteroidota bacterium]
MKQKMLLMIVFAIAMAYLEAAIVVYFRELYYPDNILAIFPVPKFRSLDFAVEFGREAATIIILVAVALLAERGRVIRRFAAFVFLFGLWDIFYYVWLKVQIGWPVSWQEWDILFLIPWAWFGPWICPVLIALIFVIWGAVVLFSQQEYTFDKKTTIRFIVGAILALFAFLQPAAEIMIQSGVEGIFTYSPGNFLWGVFAIGYIIMTVELFLMIVKKQGKNQTNQ